MMKQLILIILSFISTLSVYAENNYFQACAKVSEHNKLCEVKPQKLSKSWSSIQKVVQEVGYDDAVNPEDQFFVELRESLKKVIINKKEEMELKLACINYLNDPDLDSNIAFKGSDIKPISQKKLQDACPFIVEEIKASVSQKDPELEKSNWEQLQEALQISKSRIQRTSLPGLNVLGRSETEFKDFSADQKPSHLFNSFDIELARPSKEESETINQTILENLITSMEKFDFDTRKLKLRGGTNETSIDEEFLKKISSLPAKKQIELIVPRLEKISESLAGEYTVGSLAFHWDEKVRKKYEIQYYTKLAENPILAHVNNGSPSDSDIAEALKNLIKESENFIDRLTPGSGAKPIKLKDLAHFNPIIEYNLQHNQQSCDFANSWFDLKRKRKSIETAAHITTGVACLAGVGASLTGVGAPIGGPVALVACGSATALGVHGAIKADYEKKQIANELSLSHDSIFGRNFKDLKDAEQEDYLAKRLLVLEAAAGAKSIVALRRLGEIGKVATSQKPVLRTNFGAPTKSTQREFATHSRTNLPERVPPRNQGNVGSSQVKPPTKNIQAELRKLENEVRDRLFTLNRNRIKSIYGKEKGIDTDTLFGILQKANGPRNAPMNVDEYNTVFRILDKKKSLINKDVINVMKNREEGFDIISFLEKL